MAPRRRPGQGQPGQPRPAAPAYPPQQSPDTISGVGPLIPAQPPQLPSHLPVFPAGYGFGNDFDSMINAPLRYCAAGVVFRALLVSGQAIPGSSGTALAFDTILEDPFSGWSPVATGTQAANSWQPPFDGTYRVSVSIDASATPVTVLVAGVRVTTAVFLPVASAQGGGVTMGAGGTAMKQLAGGADYIRGYAWGSSGFTTAVGGGRETSMEITFESE